MNRLDTAMRVACRDPELDLVTRLHILELVELRQNGWALNENILAYYRQKLAQASTLFYILFYFYYRQTKVEIVICFHSVSTSSLVLCTVLMLCGCANIILTFVLIRSCVCIKSLKI